MKTHYGLALAASLIYLAGCGDSVSVTDNDESSDGSSIAVDKAPPVNGLNVAGRYNSYDFSSKYQNNQDEMAGKTWEVTGILNEDGTEFRRPRTSGWAVYVNFANPPESRDLNPLVEVTVRAIAEKRILGDVNLINAEIIDRGPRRDEHAVDVGDVFDEYSASPEYATMKYGFHGGGSVFETGKTRFRGKVISSKVTIIKKGVVFLDAGEGRFIEIDFKEDQTAGIVLGAEMTVEGQLRPHIERDEAPFLMTVTEASVIDSPDEPAPSFEDDMAIRLTADELYERVTTQKLREQIVIKEWPGFVGGTNYVLRPVIITGTVVGPRKYGGSERLDLKAVEGHAVLSCSFLPKISFEELKAGDEVSIVGICDTFNGQPGDDEIRVFNCQIWKQRPK